MKILNLIFFLFFNFYFSKCSLPSKTKNQTENSSENKWKVLVAESQCSVTAPKSIVIKSAIEFDQLWKEIQAGVEHAPVKPIVDFNTNWVVAYFLGTVSSSGHTLAITSAKPEDGKTIIEITHGIPGVNCISAQLIEYPYIIASINHLVPATVKFAEKTVEVKCE